MIIVYDIGNDWLAPGGCSRCFLLQPHMVEFYGIKMNNYNLEATRYTNVPMCKPPILIPDQAIKIHGITNEMVADELPFVSHFMPLGAFFTGTTLGVGHNISFRSDDNLP